MAIHASTSVLDRVQDWPLERRKEAERLLEAMERAGAEDYRLSAEERELVQAGLDQADRGEFVPDADMEEFWKRHDGT